MSTSAMARRLSGKTILITGASSGIGRSTAIEFARTAPDVRLVLTARRVTELEAVRAEIKAEPALKNVQIHVQKLDVSNPQEIEGLLDALPEEWRNIDVLVNNAGLVKGTEHVGQITLSDVQVMINTNVLGLITITQAILPGMLLRGRGDIINVGSIAGREGYAGGSIYCATKAAVRAFTESLRKETINSRVRIIEVDPGQVLTEFSIVRFRGDKEKAEKVYEGCEPLTPGDVAEVIVFSAGRRENVVVAETLLFPNHQAGAGVMYRKPV
ncbi:hypothetical protein DFH27DRAFT_480063 [Peziza echinospora]|nr:hypothetical protein DFH27DRAFT_480063 [Peziza echinospora]